MTHELGTCLWFDKKAKDAFLFYKDVFGEVELLSENPMAVVYKIYGRRFMHLNGGPGFPINPSISFFISASTKEELETIWNKLSVGGKIMMPLNKYPWSEQYGWCADQYGVNWQLMLDHHSSSKIMPHMMFVGANAGKAEEAIGFYTSMFEENKVVAISRYEEGEPDTTGFIKYSQFELHGLPFGAMDSSANHQFNFNEAVSFIITVDTQDEIDYYWNRILEEGQAGKCGWIKDKYGISWQVVPSILGKLMTNPATAPKATYAFLQMSKFIIADLEAAVK
jgi:predicted 3-demethylubiquinone-9 3-methyltransferase (glyoxalase superfamily)